MKNLFDLGVRFLSIYYIKEYIEYFISYIDIFRSSNYDNYTNSLFYSNIFHIIGFIIYLLLLIKPHQVSKLLKFENDSDVSFQNLDYKMLLRVGFILIGVIIFSNELLDFIRFSLFTFDSFVYGSFSVNDLFLSTLKRIITFTFSMFLIYKSDYIANFLLNDKSKID